MKKPAALPGPSHSPLTRQRLAAVLLLALLSGCKPATDSKASDAKPAADAKGGDAKAGDAKGEAAADDKPTPEVSTATVGAGTIARTLAVTGTLQTPRSQQATVSAPVGGVLDFVSVRVGQTVRRGDILAHLSTRTLQGQIAQAEATVAQNTVQVSQAEANSLQQAGQSGAVVAQAESAVAGARAALSGAQATLIGAEAAVTNARQSLARARALFADGLVARKDVETAQLAVRTAAAQAAAQRETVAAQKQTVAGQRLGVTAAQAARIQDQVKRKDIAVARAQLQSARGALESLRAQQNQYTLRAPISGAITSVGAGIGEPVDTATKIAAIANTDALQLVLAVPGASSAAIRPGQTVQFGVDALPGKTFTSVIRTVGQQIDTGTNTISVLADVPNPSHRLKDALLVKGVVVLERHRNAVLLPRAALLADVGADATENSVLRVDAKNGVVHKVAVKVGLRSGDVVEILSGLRSGDTVATTGAYGLEDGAKVTVATPEKPEKPETAKKDEEKAP